MSEFFCSDDHYHDTSCILTLTLHLSLRLSLITRISYGGHFMSASCAVIAIGLEVIGPCRSWTFLVHVCSATEDIDGPHGAGWAWVCWEMGLCTPSWRWGWRWSRRDCFQTLKNYLPNVSCNTAVIASPRGPFQQANLSAEVLEVLLISLASLEVLFEIHSDISDVSVFSSPPSSSS